MTNTNDCVWLSKPRRYFKAKGEDLMANPAVSEDVVQGHSGEEHSPAEHFLYRCNKFVEFFTTRVTRAISRNKPHRGCSYRNPKLAVVLTRKRYELLRSFDVVMKTSEIVDTEEFVALSSRR